MGHINKISIDPFDRNGKENMLGLCAECHMETSMAQGSDPDHDPMMSYFNEHNLQSSVAGERPRQHVYESGTTDPRMGCQNMDIIRCRRNAFLAGC